MSKALFFTHAGKLNLEDETLLPGDQIRETVARLVELIRHAAEGSFVPD